MGALESALCSETHDRTVTLKVTIQCASGRQFHVHTDTVPHQILPTAQLLCVDSVQNGRCLGLTQNEHVLSHIRPAEPYSGVRWHIPRNCSRIKQRNVQIASCSRFQGRRQCEQVKLSDCNATVLCTFLARKGRAILVATECDQPTEKAQLFEEVLHKGMSPTAMSRLRTTWWASDFTSERTCCLTAPHIPRKPLSS